MKYHPAPLGLVSLMSPPELGNRRPTVGRVVNRPVFPNAWLPKNGAWGALVLVRLTSVSPSTGTVASTGSPVWGFLTPLGSISSPGGEPLLIDTSNLPVGL